MKLKKATIIEEVNEVDYSNFSFVLGESLTFGTIIGLMIGAIGMAMFNFNELYAILISISFSYLYYVIKSYEYLKENKIRKIEKEVYIKQ